MPTRAIGKDVPLKVNGEVIGTAHIESVDPEHLIVKGRVLIDPEHKPKFELKTDEDHGLVYAEGNFEISVPLDDAA